MLIQFFEKWFAKTTAAQLIVLGFAAVIFLGAVLLWLPISLNPGMDITFLDALFESGSAVCVTGLTVVPVGQTFNVFGRTVMAILIQIGGMGIVLLGIGMILLAGGKLDLKTRSLFVQAQNLFGYEDLVNMARRIIILMFAIEGIGALLCWPIFMENYPVWKALGYACFHSISAFNNAGFDILGGYDSLIAYADNVPMNMVTTALVILGGFGFIAMMDVMRNGLHWKKYLLTTKVVIMMTTILLLGGMVLLKLTCDMTWMEAWFQSVIARTAGFATFPVSGMSQAGMMIFVILMFIGASPNSTGGGVKTTTIFASALKAFSSTTSHDEDSIFYRRIPDLVFSKAYVVLFFMIGMILTASIAISVLQPDAPMLEVVVEVTSAAGTVGSSAGLTTQLVPLSRIIIILVMFAGRVGPVTIANLLIRGEEKRARYTEENILIG